MNTMTQETFLAEAQRRFGTDVLDWRFVCPKCHTAQSVRELQDAVVAAGGSEDEVVKYVAFSCIGRFAGPNGPGCDWTLGGLFRIHTLEVVMPDGARRPTFELAENTAPADAGEGNEPTNRD
jgi:hypothetical protein